MTVVHDDIPPDIEGLLEPALGPVLQMPLFRAELAQALAVLRAEAVRDAFCWEQHAEHTCDRRAGHTGGHSWPPGGHDLPWCLPSPVAGGLDEWFAYAEQLTARLGETIAHCKLLDAEGRL